MRKTRLIAEGHRVKEGKLKGVSLELKSVGHRETADKPMSITPYAHRPNCDGIVAAIVENTDTAGNNRLLFLGNDRPALAETNPGTKVIELVAGKVADDEGGNEDFATAAAREVQEEGGYTPEQIKSVHAYGSFGRNHASSSGLTSEGTDFYNVKVEGQSANAVSDAGTIDDRFWVNDNLQDIVGFLSQKANDGYNISKQALTGLFMWVAEKAQAGELKLKPEA